MKVEFDREDLRPQHKDIPTSQVAFEHLNPEAQGALLIARRGVFYENGRKSYNAVYPPKKK
ncbi:hypothetical protein HON36_00965 [Candidatus Parcubacteria bacterium]|jgi:hypothetical protein|nr:hypothetical protein [Candidatus Parcubacteria bacterium]MBT7228289.1 hypothetical protein [Candidatus Parcubacteria bacterium]